MSTNHTTNYGLCQWLATDQVQRTDFNQDNAKIDTALKSLSDQVGQKAEQSVVNTLVATVNQKADQADVSALESSVQQISADLTKLTFGTYTGDGTASRTIQLGFQPKVVLVSTQWGADTFYSNFYQYYGGLALQGSPAVTQAGDPYLSIVSNGFLLSTPELVERNNVVINNPDYTYHYIALS